MVLPDRVVVIARFFPGMLWYNWPHQQRSCINEEHKHGIGQMPFDSIGRQRIFAETGGMCSGNGVCGIQEGKGCFQCR